MKVFIKSDAHANLDSLSFRYGFYFVEDTYINLINPTEVTDKKIHESHKRYAFRATFNLPNGNKNLQGIFILLRKDNTVITIIREGKAFNAEEKLSETIKKIREDGDITPDDIVEMYKQNLKDSAQLTTYLGNLIGNKKVKLAQDAADQKINRLAEALKNTANRAKRAELELQTVKDELDRYRNIELEAEKEGDTQVLAKAKVLLEVNENVIRGPSSCTELVMDDNTRLYMKTSTFDPHLTITAIAKSLVGKKVKTSCWDPLNEPGKWSNRGYFRNVYELNDEDFD